MTVDVAAVRTALADVKGIADLSLTNIGGRMVFGWDGLIAAVDPSSDLAAVEAAIRKAVATRAAVVPPPQPKGNAMNVPPPPGSFAASIRAMMDDARAGVAKARSDGLAKVQDAVGKLHEAKDATAKVAGNTAKMIEDEAASVLSELGQLSNDL